MGVTTTTGANGLYVAYTGTVQEVLDQLGSVAGSSGIAKNISQIKFVWDDTNSKLIAVVHL
jgi:hypothetical protein